MSLVELVVVVAIMVVMTGVLSLGFNMLFAKDAEYVAVRMDDMFTEARTASMSKEGIFTYAFHIDAGNPENSYVKIDQTIKDPDDPMDTGTTTEYKNVPLNKSVTVTINGSAATDLSVEFDKAKGSVKTVKINGSAVTISQIYSIEVTSQRNTSKKNTVTLISATGRHYMEK